MYIYLNGLIEKEEKAKISVFDHGFMYGLGLFETFRVYQGHPFLFHDHLHRLRKGLKELNIKWEHTNNEMLTAIQTLLNKNNLTDAYVRLNVSAGISGIGLKTEAYEEPTTIIYMKPIPVMVDEKEGVFLKIPRNTPEGQYRLKSHHYLNNILAKREVGQAPATEGIFLTREGFLAEGIVSNLFWVTDEVVYTPSIDTGILNGITRQFVIKLCSHRNIPVIEGFFKQRDLFKSSEVFVTNSIQEIVPITNIGNQFFMGKNANITGSLQKQYNKVKQSLFTFNDYVEGLDDI
jgi:4-amino-4-deoxychorismate lyase